jgi:HEXXH motif-containing protein
VDTSAISPLAADNHRLPKPYFEALCAGAGDADTVRHLWQTQRSRRMLLINAVAEAAGATPDALGPLPPAATAWNTLVRAEATAPAEATAILLHPQVGSWAAYALRRHMGGAESDVPIWVDFGALHSISLIAAARAGLNWRTQLPVRSGHVMLPGFGMAVVPSTSAVSHIAADTDAGVIRLHATGFELALPARASDDPDGWWSLRRLEAGADPRLSVWLDDIDPFRDLGDPVPPERLDEAEFARWHDLLDDAWALLRRDHRETAEAMVEGVVSLVPLPTSNGWDITSASTGEAFGSILVSRPSDATALAVALVHEFQHIKLGGLIHLAPLCRTDDDTWYYAPWRDDPRPLSGLLQGIYAFVGIAGFWRERREAVGDIARQVADFEYAYVRQQVDDALRTVETVDGLTPWGRRVVDRLSERVRPWGTELLSPEPTRLATLVATCHRVGWRIRSVRPSQVDVQRLVHAWMAGESLPARLHEAVVEPQPTDRWSAGLSGLARQRITMPDAELPADLRSNGLTGADVALMRGDNDAARAGYLARIAKDADDLHAWTGLGVADDTCSALVERPSLVRAVYLRLASEGRAPDPAALASWVEQVGGLSGA